jgi:rhodanese-related sulfurtransferase
MNKLYIGLLVLLGLGIVSGYLYQYAVASVYRVSSEKAKQLLQNNQVDLILDVRTDLERNTLGFYPNSVHIQSSDLDKEMPSRFPDKNIRILAYCNTGHRARMAVDKLQLLGYKNSRFISSTYKTLM